MQHGYGADRGVDQRKDAQKPGGRHIAKQPGGREPARRERHQRAGQNIACAALHGLGVGQHIRNHVAPRGHLCTHIKKLRYHREDKMLPLEESGPVILRGSLRRVVHAHVWEWRARNQDAPEQNNRSQNHVRDNNPQSLRLQVSAVRSRGLHRGHLRFIQFHS